MAADNTTRIVLSAVDNTSGVLQKVQLGLGNVGFAANSLRNVLSGVTSALAVRELIQAADGYASLNARLKLATNSASEFATAQAAVFNIAQRSGSDLVSVGDLYASLSRSTQQLGVSQSALLGVVESINQALVISGGSSESAAAALVQLGQGFSAGALRGEELNSVMEQAPRLAKAIADGLGVPIGKLREMGQAGELTAERVFSALQKSSGALQKEFEQMPITVSRATTEAGNSLLRLIGVIDQATGATGALALAISGVSRGVDNYIDRLTGQGIQKAQADVDDLRQRLVIMMQTKSEDHPMVKLLQNQLDKAVQTLQTLKREMSGDQTAAETARLRRMGSSPEAGPSLSSVAGIQEQIKKLTALRNAADINSDTFKRLSAEIKQYQDRLDKAVPSAKSPRPKSVAALKSAGLTYDEQITQRVGQLFEGSDITRAKEYSDTLAKLDELFYSGAIGGDLYDSAVKKLTGSTAEAGEASTELADQQARLAQLLAGTASAALEEQRNDMLLLAAAFEKGTITARQFEEASTARLGLTGPDAKRATEDFGASLHDDVKNALSNAFRDTKNPLQAFGDALYNVVFTRVTGGLANSIADGLLGKDGGGGGLLSGVSDWFSGLLSFDGGGYTGTGARAGGMDGRGGFLAMLHPNETVVDHTRGQSAGASVTVNVINQSGQAVDAQQRSRTGADGQQIIDVVLSAVGDSLANRSGPVSRGLEAGYGIRPAMA